MATITGYTAARMKEIEDAAIISGSVVGSHLILTRHDGITVDAGDVTGPQGPTGPMGPGAGMIPGEIRLWSGAVLPDFATFARWVWADGASYLVADHPLAAANISPAWKTFGGASDPGVASFRVPDLRGLTPTGLDQMPGGVRANRLTRSVAITLAAKTGEETHIISINEMPSHSHNSNGSGNSDGSSAFIRRANSNNSGDIANVVKNTGGGVAHENMQPSVFVPYIVMLDGS